MIFDPETLPDYADRLEAVELYEAFRKAEDDYIAHQYATNAGDLSIAAQDALEAYEVHGVDLLIDGLSGQIIRCALTGVPLLSEVSDSEWVLAAAVKPKAGQELPDMAEAV